MHPITKFGLAALGAGLMLTSTTADAQARRGGHVRGSNGAATVVSGPNGTAARAGGARRNADGSVTAASGGAFRTATGATGVRGSTTTVNPDGSGNRTSGLSSSGARGSLNSSSNVSRAADGSYSGGRSTTATSTATGNTYSGSTQIDPATGKPVYSGTCTNASGQTITCPR